jgi:hypothetical protein
MSNSRPVLEELDADDAIDEQGVDRTLVRWMLSLTPAERLAHLQRSIDAINSAKPRDRGPR